MLTLQLFLGYEELPGLDSVVFRNQEDIDTYLGLVFATLGPRGWISDASKSFICGCLAFDSERRPKARQAFYHAWLQEPTSDRKMFKRLEADNALSWKPQKVKFPVVEDLTAWSPGQGNGQGVEERALEDTTSPHFMLSERPRTSTRQQAPGPPLPPHGALTSGQAQEKRKRDESDKYNVKQPRLSPC
jgi:hypothetical protein